MAIDAFMAVGDAPTPSRISNHPNIDTVTERVIPDSGSRAHCWPLTAFLSVQRARAKAQSRLATRLIERHADRPYDVVYQFSQFELLGLRRYLHALPPIVVHPETHAAGELRWLVREAKLAHRCDGHLTWVAAVAMLAARSTLQFRDARSMAGIVAPSRVFGEHLQRDYRVAPERMHVVPNAVDLSQFGASSAARQLSGPIKILFVSRMAVRKGVDMVVALSHRLADLSGQVEIEAVGNEAMWSDYRPLLKGLNPAVGRHRAWVSPSELAHLYTQADLLVQPSLFEPFALTVAEALASGVPVIASHEVGACEDVDPVCCSLFQAGDLDGFESAVREAVARCRSPLGDASRALARSEAERLFSPKLVANRLRDVLCNLAADRKRGCPSPSPSPKGQEGPP